MPHHTISYQGRTHTHTHILTIRTRLILRNQVHASVWPVRAWFKNQIQFLNQPCAWFLKIDHVRIVGMRTCVCVCVCAQGY